MKQHNTSYNTFFLAKALIMFGISFWLTVAILNNITDFSTNHYLLTAMMDMTAIKSEPILGKGLEWRAIASPTFSEILLGGIIVVESVIALLLCRAAYSWLKISRLFKKSRSSTR